MEISLGFITARTKPNFSWFCDSLSKQVQPDDLLELVVIDTYAEQSERRAEMECDFVDAFINSGMEENVMPLVHTLPKPTIWSGRHRITKEDWWSKSNSLNTFICLAKYPFLVMIDDRCILVPQWLQCVKDAMDGNYAVCGRYEKRANLKVENGVIVDEGELLGMDQRPEFDRPVNHRDWYGGSCALPLEWCLRVNGFPEMADGLGMEDCLFGETLLNNGFPIKYDARMKIIEDRTPGEIDGALKRADKNPHLGQQAKSWTLLRAIRGKRDSQNPYDIRNLRDRILLNGESLQDIPPAASHFDYYDGEAISEMQ